MLFIGIEVLRRGKRISPEREGLVNLIGMGMLLFLMLVVTFNDVGNLRAPLKRRPDRTRSWHITGGTCVRAGSAHSRGKNSRME